MSNYKVNQKSIRVSDDVLRYIEEFNGDNFNDKLNNLIYYFMKIVDDKKEEIARLDGIIKDKEKEYSNLVDSFINLERIKRTERYFINILSDYNDDLKKFNNSFLKVVCKDGK